MYSCSTDVIATDLEQELIILDPRSCEMFTLNAAGRCVWLALPARSVDDIAGVLQGQFDVTPELARRDVQSFLTQLTEAALIEFTPDG